MKVVAYGPYNTPIPGIPDTFVLEKDGARVLMFQYDNWIQNLNDATFSGMMESSQLRGFPEPLDHQDGKILVLGLEAPEWIFQSEEASWKQRQADLAIQNKTLGPEAQLENLQAAAQLQGWDLLRLVKHLQANQQENESLAAVFLRLRDGNAPLKPT